MHLQPQSIQHTAAGIQNDQDDAAGAGAGAGAGADTPACGQQEAATGAEAEEAHTAEAAQASPRPAPSSPGSPGSKGEMGPRRKPWGSSMTPRSGSREGSQSFEGGSSRDRAVGSWSPGQRFQQAKRGLSQSSLRLRSGFSMGSFLDSFHSVKTDSSRSEGGSPRHRVGRLPSFMASTRSSQAHVQGQSSQTAADSVEQDEHSKPFRASGAHVVTSSNSDAEHAAEGKAKQAQHAQHSQHGHAEVSPRSVTSGVSGSFMDSTQSSLAHHFEELKQQHPQHNHRTDGELTADPEAVSMHHSHDVTSNSSTAVQGVEKPSDHVHGSSLNDVAHMLPQSAGHESQTHLGDAGASENGQGLHDTKCPGFMQPTVSSLAHNATSPRTSLGKSVSMNNV